jgi:hypothetical protein
MKRMEQQELDAHHGDMVADMSGLVEKYRKIFDWDIPEIDQHAADKLIVTTMQKALSDIAKKLAD